MAMNYSAVTRTDIAPGLLLIAALTLASCSNLSNAVPLDYQAAPAAITPQQEAAQDCWMETEHGAKSLPLDKRAKMVDKCVKDKMSAAK